MNHSATHLGNPRSTLPSFQMPILITILSRLTAIGGRLACLINSAGAPVCFMEGLVRFKGKWLLYYEAGDHVGAMATCDKPGFETKK